jgi:hypothetical protein
VGDDTGVLNVPIGFPFGFYDQVFTSIGVSPNGYLSFGATLDAPRGTSIPNQLVPNWLIAPRWNNLNPIAGGSVRYATMGQAPTRRFIVQWNAVPQFAMTDANTFQAVLFEGDGAIEFRYKTVTPPRFNGDVVIGLENGSGLRGTSVSANQMAENSSLALRKGNLTPPVSVAGGSYQLSATLQETVADAGGSFDPDGQQAGFAGIASVQWDLGGDGVADDQDRTQRQTQVKLAQALAKGLRIGTPVPLRLTVRDFDKRTRALTVGKDKNGIITADIDTIS